MFLPSQLADIAQRFQPDVEDLQVLLQEEGLPVRSPESLQELSTRLKSDPRFRGDVAFLLQSILNHGPEEPGSMDVLGVLVVAAAGTRQNFDAPPQHELLRDLLRFVMQQRRPAPHSGAAEQSQPPVVVPAHPRSSEPELSVRRRPVLEPPASESRPLPAAAMPSLAQAGPEPFWRRGHAVWIVALLALLLGFGAGFIVRHGRTPAEVTMASAPPAVPPGSAPPAAPVQAATPPDRMPAETSRSESQKGKASRKTPASASRASRRHSEPQTPPAMVASNALPKIQPRADNSPQPPQPVLPNATQHPPAALVQPPVDSSRQRNVPTPNRNPFVHPEAAASNAASQPSPELTRPREPVLIARNAPPNSPAVAAKPQGTVHLGSTGNMASNLMYSPEPEYPADAIAAGVQGEVTVRAIVGPNGNVIEARVVSGPPLLRDAALQAVQRWRYRPYEQEGRPITVATTAILDFQIPPKTDH